MSHAGPDDFLSADEPTSAGNSIPMARPQPSQPQAQPQPRPQPTVQKVQAPNHVVPDVEALLIDAIEIIETARPAPLSTAIKIEGEPLLDLLYEARDRLPDELRAARWLLRDRDAHLETQRIEGEEIIAAARSRAQHLVERTEVVRSAEQRAQRIISEAKAEARQMRRETEDFCDSRLASLESILDRTRTVVGTGRARLQGVETIDLTDSAVANTREEPQVTYADHQSHQQQPPPPGPAANLFDQDEA